MGTTQSAGGSASPDALQRDWARLLAYRPNDHAGAAAFGSAVEAVGLLPTGGHNPRTGLRTVMVALPEGDFAAAARAAAGIRALLPHYPPRDDGWVPFAVRDWGFLLSEGHHLLIVRSSDDSARLAFANYGSENEGVPFATLREALEHIATHMWSHRGTGREPRDGSARERISRNR
jgi:hypothetical protein